MKTSDLKFSDMYEQYHEKLHRYLQRMVGTNDAEDLTQEVFVKIDNALKDFQGKSSLSTWVYRIATNAALDKLNSRAAREANKKVGLDELGDGPETENLCIDETSLSAEREAIRNEMNECIREYIDKLPQDYRTVIILSEMKELKNQEIADILGVSLDAVKIRLHRARAKMKAEFEAGCDFYHDKDGRLACDRKESDEKTP